MKHLIYAFYVREIDWKPLIPTDKDEILNVERLKYAT